MADTQYYNLKKPSYLVTADIGDMNDNMDTIDSTLHDKLDAANVYNGLDKTASGFALDARQGKTLSDNINRREVQKAVYAQLNDNGNPSVSTLTAYPTTTGLFRVGSKTNCPGLPTDSNGYGPLLIFNAGGYVLHIHRAANNRMWYGSTIESISAPSSWIEIAQNSKIVSYKNDAATIAELKTDLLAFVDTLSVNDVRNYSFWTSGSMEAPFSTGQLYAGDITVTSKETNSLRFSAVFSCDNGTPISVGYNAGTWKIEALALNSNLSDFAKGPSSATYNYLAAFNDTTGKLLKDSGVPIASLMLIRGSASNCNTLTAGGFYTISVSTQNRPPDFTNGWLLSLGGTDSQNCLQIAASALLSNSAERQKVYIRSKRLNTVTLEFSFENWTAIL